MPLKHQNTEFHKNEELRELAPTLSKIEKRDPFRVPLGYFEALPAIIQERCIENKRPALSEWLQLILNPRVLAPVSLAIVLIITGIVFFISSPPQIKEDALLCLEQLSAEDVYSAMEAGDLNEIDEYLIVDALIEVEYKSGEPDEEIINYLMENGIELSTITNQF